MDRAPYFFGYGSLVNRATHSYDDTYLATLEGWRREWRRVPGHDISALSVAPAREHDRIDGLIARVSDACWSALDAREAGYIREAASGVRHGCANAECIEVYRIVEEGEVAPIALSYLDVVVEGFLLEFGLDGVERFFATTDGWSAPLIDDRDRPLYPRKHHASHAVRSLVDIYLGEVR